MRPGFQRHPADVDPRKRKAAGPETRRLVAPRPPTRRAITRRDYFQPGKGKTAFFLANLAGKTVSLLPPWYWITGISCLFWFTKPS